MSRSQKKEKTYSVEPSAKTGALKAQAVPGVRKVVAKPKTPGRALPVAGNGIVGAGQQSQYSVGDFGVPFSLTYYKEVFAITVPLSLAPTLNVYAGQKPWQRGKLRAALDAEIAQAMPFYLKVAHPLLANGDRRRIVVTRYSSREPDELAVDIIGGKAIVDRLVIAGILAGDSRKHLEREARWVACKAGAGRLVVQVLAL